MGNEINISLREHQKGPLPKGFPTQEFISYLDEIWMNRLLYADKEFGEEPNGFEPSLRQPFFHFTYNNQIKSKNYIGFIRWGDYIFHLVPKVFEQEGHNNLQAWEHLFYWLSYCRRVVFPFARVLTFPRQIDNLAEALIYVFAKYTNGLLSENPYSQFEEVTSSGQVLKGRLNISDYIDKQFTKGNMHHLVMEHEPFVHDNLLNSIIKQVASSLQDVCRFTDTFHELQGIIFQLEEVTDMPISVNDCDRVKLNRLFTEYQLVLDMCRFFLSESYLTKDAGSLSNLSFLLPMEYIYEDFISGFLDSHFGTKFKVDSQKREWLTDQKVFQIRNDILLTERETGEKLIIDTKYKLRQSQHDAKKGISQVDLYQMVSYALRVGCRKVLLLYPNHKTSNNDIEYFSVSSPMINGSSISVFAADVPISFHDLNQADSELKQRMSDILCEII